VSGISASLSRACARIQSRLDRDALAHLREHCAEQAARITELESQIEALQRDVDMWSDMWMQQRDHDLDVERDRDERYRIGITQDCQIVRLPVVANHAEVQS
jgi:TolA-binding protein